MGDCRHLRGHAPWVGVMRLVSLVPSVTELLFALGLEPWLVGRTGFCMHPPKGVAKIPKVGGTKDVNLEKLRRLAPTHVIVNVDENRLDTVEAMRAFIPQVVVTHPKSPADNLALLTQLTDVFAVELEKPGAGPAEMSAAQALRRRARDLADELSTELARCRGKTWPSRRVLYLIWRGPWMTVARDTYIARMLAEVGWDSWPPVEGGDHGAARYPSLLGDEPWLADIDELLLSSEPYRFGPEHVAEAQTLCPRARVRLVDGELISWYGPRAAAGLAYLRGLAAEDAAPDFPTTA